MAYARLGLLASIFAGSTLRFRQVIAKRGSYSGLFGMYAPGSLLGNVTKLGSFIPSSPFSNIGSAASDLINWISGKEDPREGSKSENINMPLISVMVPKQFLNKVTISYQYPILFCKWFKISDDGTEIAIPATYKTYYLPEGIDYQDPAAVMAWGEITWKQYQKLTAASFGLPAEMLAGYSPGNQWDFEPRTRTEYGTQVSADLTDDLTAVAMGATTTLVAAVLTDPDMVRQYGQVIGQVAHGISAGINAESKLIDAVVPDSIV